MLVKEKTFRTEPKTGALRLTFDDLDLLKILNMDPVVENAVELMPDWLRGLEGKTIRLRGVMYPTFDAEGLENFVLARDSQTCCFGREPKIYDLIQVDMKARQNDELYSLQSLLRRGGKAAYRDQRSRREIVRTVLDRRRRNH